MEIIGVLILALLVIFGASKKWKLAIKSVLVIAVLEGALRRWAFPEARDLIYFFKDFILIGSYIGFASRPRPFVDRYPFIKELTLVVAIVCCLQAFNPSLGSPIVGLIGIRSYLLYIPLIWVIPHLFDSWEDLRDFLRKYLLLLIPVCILGVIQYFSPQDSPLNVYIAGEEQLSTALVGEFVRITGTFSYIVGMTTYLSFCFSLLVVLIARDRVFKWQVIYTVELTLVVVNSFMSGARGIIVYEILFVIGYLVFGLLHDYKSALNLIKLMFIPTVLATIVAVVYFQPAIAAFSDRATSNSDVEERILGSFTQVSSYADIRLDGYGVGATQNGANTLRVLLGLRGGERLPPSEGETGRVVIEIGLLGFGLWYSLRILLLISLYSVFRKLKNPLYKELALSAFLFQAINITGQLVTNPTMLVYFWFFGGFIYLLPALEDREAQQDIFANISSKPQGKLNNLDDLNKQ
jgi:hypothetical protein